jgi:hypothetical protein
MPLSSTDNAKCHLPFAARRRCWRTPFSKNQGFVAQIVRAAMVCALDVRQSSTPINLSGGPWRGARRARP